MTKEQLAKIGEATLRLQLSDARKLLEPDVNGNLPSLHEIDKAGAMLNALSRTLDTSTD